MNEPCPKRDCRVYGGYFTLDISYVRWVNGLFIVNLQTEKEALSKKFVKEYEHQQR
jgi:hypothetical protein